MLIGTRTRTTPNWRITLSLRAFFAPAATCSRGLGCAVGRRNSTREVRRPRGLAHVVRVAARLPCGPCQVCRLAVLSSSKGATMEKSRAVLVGLGTAALAALLFARCSSSPNYSGAQCAAAGGLCFLAMFTCTEAPQASQDCAPEPNPGGETCCLDALTAAECADAGGACLSGPACSADGGTATTICTSGEEVCCLPLTNSGNP